MRSTQASRRGARKRCRGRRQKGPLSRLLLCGNITANSLFASMYAGRKPTNDVVSATHFAAMNRRAPRLRPAGVTYLLQCPAGLDDLTGWIDGLQPGGCKAVRRIEMAVSHHLKQLGNVVTESRPLLRVGCPTLAPQVSVGSLQGIPKILLDVRILTKITVRRSEVSNPHGLRP